MNIKTTNSVSGLFALLLAIGCSGTKADQPSETLGEMSSGGRNRANSLRVQFASKGSGIDGIGQLAFLNLVNRETENGTVTSFQQRPWGREGEINYCVTLATNADEYRVSKILGRIIWIGIANGNLNSFAVTTQCDDAALEIFAGNQRGPFNQISHDTTLTCQLQAPQADQYEARLLLEESIVIDANQYATNEIEVRMNLQQSSPIGRYAAIHDLAVTKTVSPDGAITYTGSTLDLNFSVASGAGATGYSARLTIGNTGMPLLMTCEEAR
jgi:hypothetical protein